jgi:hypothetical protein
MPNYNVKTGLPQLPSGLNDTDFALVRPLYLAMNSLAQGLGDATGKVDFEQGELAQRNQLASVITGQHRKLYARNDTGAPLGYGKIVTLSLSGGKIIAQYADSTNNTKPAHGIVNNPLGIDAGNYGEIMLIEGWSAGIAGTTFGSYYYLSTVGNVQLARPAAAGTIIQACGFGLGTAGFYLHISPLFLQN